MLLLPELCWNALKNRGSRVRTARRWRNGRAAVRRKACKKMCTQQDGCETVFSDALAKAAVIAYLNLSRRDAEAEEMSRVGT